MKRVANRRLKLAAREALIPSNLPFQVHLLSQAMTRALVQEVLQEYDLTPLHWGILCCLWREDGVRTTVIAHCLDQLGGTITVGLDAMEKRKLVQRATDDEDRRISRVFLSGYGRSLEAILVPKAHTLIERMFGHLSHRQYSDLLTHITAIRFNVNGLLTPPAS